MKRFLQIALILIVLYLVLIHFTGFSSDVTALARGTTATITAFQGR